MVERYRAVGFRFTWLPVTRGMFGLKTKPVPVEVIDLSVSGALILAPHHPKVGSGTIVPIVVDGGKGLVEVRHVQEAPDPAMRYYGLLFVELQPALRRRIHELVASQRGDLGRLEWAWQRAR